MAKASGSGLFNFSPFSYAPSSATAPAAAPVDPPVEKKDDAPARLRNDNPRTMSSGFDPEALKRGAKALREIAASKETKKTFDLMMKHEETRQTELAVNAAEFKTMQAQSETERQRVIYYEQKKLAQQEAQIK
ncbi:ATPase family AAA domain-containing protein 3-B, partial [Tanacetum coccineum]